MAQKKGRMYSRYQQGSFNPINKERYKGSLPITYRSSYELTLMRWLDNNSNCDSWGSESAVVSYFYKGKKHKYFVDFTAVMKTKNGLVKFYIEVKPYKQTIPPVQTKNKKTRTYLQECLMWEKNSAKWEAAKVFASKKGGKFILMTEKTLYR